MFAYALGSIIILYIVLDLTWRLWIRKYSAISCPFQVPWLGSAPYLERAPNKFFEQLNNAMKYDKTILLWFVWKPVVFSSKHEVVEAVLRSSEMIKKSFHYDFLHDWLGTGLLTSWGKKWKQRRRAITPSFHFSILNDFIEIFIRHTNTLVEKVKVAANNNEIIDLQKIISHATLDVICDTAMGVSVDAQSQDSEYVKSIHFLNNQLLYRMRTPWLWPTFFYYLTSDGRKYFQQLKLVQQFTTDVINKRIATRTQNKNGETKRKQAFIDMLLDLYDRGEINIEGIREEVDTFMFEGHDTTSACLSWTLYELGNNEEVQKKLQTEIDASESIEGSIMDKINATKYLEYVIKEGLRKHPPVPIFGREIEKDENVGGIQIMKGTTLVVQCYSLHRSEEYWTEPNEFKPERLEEERFAKRNPYMYVPFSAGPRNCIGQKFAMMEMKIVLYYLMKYFNIKSLQREDELICTIDIIHKSLNGLSVQFSCRNK